MTDEKAKALFESMSKECDRIVGIKTYPRTMEDYRAELDRLRMKATRLKALVLEVERLSAIKVPGRLEFLIRELQSENARLREALGSIIAFRGNCGDPEARDDKNDIDEIAQEALTPKETK